MLKCWVDYHTYEETPNQNKKRYIQEAPSKISRPCDLSSPAEQVLRLFGLLECLAGYLSSSPDFRIKPFLQMSIEVNDFTSGIILNKSERLGKLLLKSYMCSRGSF